MLGRVFPQVAAPARSSMRFANARYHRFSLDRALRPS